MTAKKDNGTAERTDLQKAEDAEALDVFEQFKTLGTNLQVVTRREPGARYLELVTLEGFDEDVMRERYGGGKFSLEVRREGKYVTGSKKRHMEIEGVPKIFPAVAPDSTNPEIIRLRSEIEKLTGEPVAIVQPASENVMVAMAGLMAPVLTALITSAMDRPPPPDPLAILNLARKMARDDRADSAAPSGLDPILEHMGIPLVGAIQKMTGQKETKALPAPADNPPEGKPQTIPEVAQFVARWCAPHCSRATNPALRAELLMEELTIQDPELLEAVVELSNVPDVLDHWVRMIPEVGLHREWHGAFIEEVRQLAADREPTESVEPVEPDSVADQDDSDGGRGDAGDDSGDAKTGEVGGPG